MSFMGVDWPGTTYGPNYDYFARTIIITPVVSQPGAPAYTARGIYNTGDAWVPGLDGSLIASAMTIVDILVNEFPILPAQGDLIEIPDTTCPGGPFEISNVSGDNAGGEITLTLKRAESMLLTWNISVRDYDLGAPVFEAPHWTAATSAVHADDYDVASPVADAPDVTVTP
ncbi:MAG: hypothetical protein J2P55_02260 [Rhizobiales bacterium]|nr:hypothetical protein [Hyphomicrobiales bacterium]